MKPAPIQLIEYVTEEVAFEVNPGYRTGTIDEEPASTEETFSVRPEVFSYPEGEVPGRLRLTVSVNEGRKEFAYYRLRIAVAGRFQHIDPNPPVEAVEVRAYYLKSGFSVLYGVVRTLVVQLCAASPYPRLVLPTVTFDEEVAELLSTEEEG